MRIYTYSYNPSTLNSFFDQFFCRVLDIPVTNTDVVQNKLPVENDVKSPSYPIEIKLAAKVAVMHPQKRAKFGYELKSAIDNALAKGINEGSLVLNYDLDDSISSIRFLKDLNSLIHDTPYMVISGSKKALEIIRNMGYQTLSYGDDAHMYQKVCKITNVYTDDDTVPESDSENEVDN